MTFEPVDNITTLIDIKDITANMDEMFYRFIEYEDEVYYVVDNKKVLGLITIRDVQESINNDNILKYNDSFCFVTSKDDIEGASRIFEEIPKIHEVPVISEGKLCGIIKSGKRRTKEEWEAARGNLIEGEIYEYHISSDEISELMKLGCRFFVYPYIGDLSPEDSVSKEELQIYQEKIKRCKGEFVPSKMTEREQQLFLGEYSKKYKEKIKEFFAERRIEMHKGIRVCKTDADNLMYTYNNGKRLVPNALPEGNKVILVGACTFSGQYVANEEAVSAYLQKNLLKSGYRVENLALAADYSIKRLFIEKISPNDIVVVMTRTYDLWKELSAKYPAQIMCTDGLEGMWKEIDNPVDCIYDDWNHCNWKVNQIIAERIYKDIAPFLMKKEIEGKMLYSCYAPPGLEKYYKMHFKKNVKETITGKIGAIVMNCNPFTQGHRYLIEQASQQVDYLYIFVVQEDRSEFPFVDRLEMVKRGVNEFENVCVLPSGRYIISKETFGDYFVKQEIQNTNDPEYDVAIFGRIVSKVFGIHVRFVGEEPYDKVTRRYNETMKRMLPQYGVEVVEIPRVANINGDIISATKVRKYMKENSVDKLQLMLPESTIKYLYDHKYMR